MQRTEKVALISMVPPTTLWEVLYMETNHGLSDPKRGCLKILCCTTLCGIVIIPIPKGLTLIQADN